jgi:hypothetical protein
MGNSKYDEGVTIIGRTYRNDDMSTILIIPTELAKQLQIENSKVSMSLLDGFGGIKHLLVSKSQREITIE